MLLIRPLLLALLIVPCTAAQEPPASHVKGLKPIPLTRAEMKKALDSLKEVSPRLPLPPGEEGSKGVNNGRMRAFYIPEELRVGGVGGFGFSGKKGFGRDKEKSVAEKSDYTFGTKVFWIVSRINNCQYCLGHQENKLASSGLEEDIIAALDGDWREFTDKEQLAFNLATRLTLRPDLVSPEDLEPLRKHYTDLEILNLVANIAGYNAMNRWTDGLAIPQEKHRDFLSVLSPRYKDKTSLVALRLDEKGNLPEKARRPALPGQAQIDKALAGARGRKAWLKLADEEEARKFLPEMLEGTVKKETPNWVRLYALLRGAEGRIQGQFALQSKGNLEPKLRAQIDYIAALHDRSWYALELASRRLKGLGESPELIAALANQWEKYGAKERAAFHLVRISTVAPMTVSDGDIEALRKHFSDTQTAEILHRTCAAAAFNRITETMRLPLED